MRSSLPFWTLFVLGCGANPHPAGYENPDLHGHDFIVQTDDCRTCHGEALDGGSARTWDGCHADDWRTDCTFCHGGTETDGGAPPTALFDPESAFDVHTEHVRGEVHPEYACAQCHNEPESVTSAGHTLDGSAGTVEVDFTHGLSPDGSWDGAGCSNLYCHGDGQDEGDVELDYPPECGDCHAVATSS